MDGEMFGYFVFQLGKRYSQLRDAGVDYPQWDGRIRDLIDDDLEQAQGEYVIVYQRGGTWHHIRVYIEAGDYQATGMPASDAIKMNVELEN